MRDAYQVAKVRAAEAALMAPSRTGRSCSGRRPGSPRSARACCATARRGLRRAGGDPRGHRRQRRGRALRGGAASPPRGVGHRDPGRAAPHDGGARALVAAGGRVIPVRRRATRETGTTWPARRTRRARARPLRRRARGTPGDRARGPHHRRAARHRRPGRAPRAVRDARPARRQLAKRRHRRGRPADAASTPTPATSTGPPSGPMSP